jgi:hypothetical protein
MWQRFGGADVFKQPARRVMLSAYLLNVADTFESYERADSQIEWRRNNPQGADFIDRIKDIIDDGDD